jgi:hypothetical protein
MIGREEVWESRGPDNKGLNLPGRGLFRVLTGEDGLDGFELLILLAGCSLTDFQRSLGRHAIKIHDKIRLCKALSEENTMI